VCRTVSLGPRGHVASHRRRVDWTTRTRTGTRVCRPRGVVAALVAGIQPGARVMIVNCTLYKNTAPIINIRQLVQQYRCDRLGELFVAFTVSWTNRSVNS